MPSLKVFITVSLCISCVLIIASSEAATSAATSRGRWNSYGTRFNHRYLSAPSSRNRLANPSRPILWNSNNYYYGNSYVPTRHYVNRINNNNINMNRVYRPIWGFRQPRVRVLSTAPNTKPTVAPTRQYNNTINETSTLSSTTTTTTTTTTSSGPLVSGLNVTDLVTTSRLEATAAPATTTTTLSFLDHPLSSSGASSTTVSTTTLVDFAPAAVVDSAAEAAAEVEAAVAAAAALNSSLPATASSSTSATTTTATTTIAPTQAFTSANLSR